MTKRTNQSENGWWSVYNCFIWNDSFCHLMRVTKAVRALNNTPTKANQQRYISSSSSGSLFPLCLISLFCVRASVDLTAARPEWRWYWENAFPVKQSCHTGEAPQNCSLLWQWRASTATATPWSLLFSRTEKEISKCQKGSVFGSYSIFFFNLLFCTWLNWVTWAIPRKVPPMSAKTTTLRKTRNA